MARATVSLEALAHNITRIKQYISPDTLMLAAVKANAYGHGAVPVAKHLLTLGVTWFGVATREEALELRQGGVGGNILIFTPVYSGLEDLITHDVSLTVVDAQSLESVARAAAVAGKRARVHLKVDTGMGRLGLEAKAAVAVAKLADRIKEVTLEAVWTHFACSDEEERERTEAQIGAFEGFLEALRGHDIEVPLRHAANSAGIIAYPEAQYDMVRPGIMLYGYSSSDCIERQEPELKPVMTVRAPVTFVKRIGAGRSISYNAGWTSEGDTTVASVRFGYADGYPRALSNKGEVFAHRRLYPIRGRVCMDQFMVDFGDDEVAVGDEVEIYGDRISAETLGRACGTISYEVLTRLSPRVQRHYE